MVTFPMELNGHGIEANDARRAERTEWRVWRFVMKPMTRLACVVILFMASTAHAVPTPVQSAKEGEARIEKNTDTSKDGHRCFVVHGQVSCNDQCRDTGGGIVCPSQAIP